MIEFPLIEGLEILRTLAAKNISPSKWFRFRSFAGTGEYLFH
ncbi:MAG: hypothetical protein R2875_09395 [Desulfobacterales bacterium]